MDCPFCGQVMEKWIPRTHVAPWTNYSCNDEGCRVDDMPRYQISIDYKGTMSYQFMIDNSYVSVDFEKNITMLSRLEACILLDTITLPRVIQFDMNDLVSVSEKVKTLLLFS